MEYFGDLLKFRASCSSCVDQTFSKVVAQTTSRIIVVAIIKGMLQKILPAFIFRPIVLLNIDLEILEIIDLQHRWFYHEHICSRTNYCDFLEQAIFHFGEQLGNLTRRSTSLSQLLAIYQHKKPLEESKEHCRKSYAGEMYKL